MMPNFLVIGAAKAGTTSIWRYLRQHPQIYMSPHKEPRFFALEGRELDFKGPGDMTRFHFRTEIEDYRSLFDDVTDEKAIGEVSPWYLYVPQSAERIRHHIPDAKLIAILRDPVERAYSNYLHSVREGLEPLTDFVAAMEAEPARIEQNWSYRWHYKQKGFYTPQIKRYLELFDREQIRVYLYEDLQSEPSRLLRDVFGFLEVDEDFEPKVSERFNTAAVPRNALLDRVLNKRNPVKSLVRQFVPSQKLRKAIRTTADRFSTKPKVELSPSVRSRYLDEYRDDILQLQDLIGRDLSKWMIV